MTSSVITTRFVVVITIAAAAVLQRSSWAQGGWSILCLPSDVVRLAERARSECLDRTSRRRRPPRRPRAEAIGLREVGRLFGRNSGIDGRSDLKEGVEDGGVTAPVGDGDREAVAVAARRHRRRTRSERMGREAAR